MTWFKCSKCGYLRQTIHGMKAHPASKSALLLTASPTHLIAAAGRET